MVLMILISGFGILMGGLMMEAGLMMVVGSDEAELLAKYAQHAYKQFQNKAAFSRSMPVDKTEEVAQGRIWTGKDAASRGYSCGAFKTIPNTIRVTKWLWEYSSRS